MGYARASLLGGYIVDAVDETKTVAGTAYSSLRTLVAVSVWKPPGIEDELDGMVASLAGWGVAIAAGLMWVTVAAIQRLRG
jgi:hypothetical protein